jgi:hypothetical protein
MPCVPLLPILLLTSLFAVGQSPAAADSLPLAAARWVTPVTLTPVTTRHGPGVRLEYGRPCLAEAGTRLRTLMHNSYQGSVVKRADGCTAGAGWPSAKQAVNRRGQASVADLIAVAGHSLRLHQTPIEGRYSCTSGVENSGPREGHALDTLLYPRPGLLNRAGCVRRHS